MAQSRASPAFKKPIVAACAVCLEILEKSLAALPCGHVFHQYCIEKALACRPACPVCRRQASSRNAVRLYLSFGAGHGNASCKGAFNNEVTTVSRIPERLQEMKSKLDHAHKIQRTSLNHSLRLESDVLSLKQKLQQTTRKLQHTQRALDSAEIQLRIATKSFARYNEAKRALLEFDSKVRTSANQMLEKIRERQYSRCCASEWAELKCIAREFAAAGSGSRITCCQHHTPARLAKPTVEASLTSYSQALR